MEKYCLSCFKKIPIMASRCPYCIKDGQSVWGRMLLLILLIIALFIGAKIYFGKEADNSSRKELIELLDSTNLKGETK